MTYIKIGSIYVANKRGNPSDCFFAPVESTDCTAKQRKAIRRIRERKRKQSEKGQNNIRAEHKRRRVEGVEVSSSFHPALSYRFRTFPRSGHGLGQAKNGRFGSSLICLKSERKCRFLIEIGTLASLNAVIDTMKLFLPQGYARGMQNGLGYAKRKKSAEFKAFPNRFGC